MVRMIPDIGSRISIGLYILLFASNLIAAPVSIVIVSAISATVSGRMEKAIQLSTRTICAFSEGSMLRKRRLYVSSRPTGNAFSAA